MRWHALVQISHPTKPLVSHSNKCELPQQAANTCQLCVCWSVWRNVVVCIGVSGLGSRLEQGTHIIISHNATFLQSTESLMAFIEMVACRYRICNEQSIYKWETHHKCRGELVVLPCWRVVLYSCLRVTKLLPIPTQSGICPRQRTGKQTKAKREGKGVFRP